MPWRTGSLLLAAVALGATEGTAFRLLALPLPWTQRITVEGGWEGRRDARLESGQDLAVQRTGGSATLRLLGDERRTLLLEAGGETIDLDASDPVVFAGSGTRVPGHIDRVGIGFSGRWIDPAGRRWVGALGVESASDDLEEDDEAIEYRAFGAVFLPTSGHEGWMLGLGWRSTADWPLPVIGYAWVPSPEFRATIGLPFLFASWDPDPAWSLSLRTFALNPGLELRHRPAEAWAILARLSREGWNGRVAARSDEDLRLSEDGWTAGLALEHAWRRDRSLRLELGWAFERELVEEETGRDLFDQEEEGSIDLDDAPYLRATAAWAW